MDLTALLESGGTWRGVAVVLGLLMYAMGYKHGREDRGGGG